MASEKTRVNFNAPESLIERADSVVEVLDISRTRLLINALEEEIDNLTNDEEFRRRLSEAYYDGRMGYDSIEAILGREEALRMKLLRESVDRTPAEPQLKDSLPSDEAFYEDAEWTDDTSSNSSEHESRV